MMLYSPLKVFHHRDKLDQLRAGVQPCPAQVQVVLTNRCNNNCRFCSYRMDGYTSNQLFDQKSKIEYSKVIEILDDCVEMGVGAIQLTGGGEPSIHPRFPDVLRGVLDRCLDLAVVTNGNVMSAGTSNLLSKATWVRFSLDAANQETYSSIRKVKPEMFCRTIGNIASVVENRRLNGTDAIIGIGFVVTQDNYLEIIDAVKIARNLGVDNIRLSAVFQTEGAGYFAGIHDEIVEMCQEAKSMETDEFIVFNNFSARFSDLEQESPDYDFCGVQHFDTYIGADLSVYRCCVLAYNQRGFVGSISHSSFKELWESEEKQSAFKDFNARGCPRCMFNEKNRMISYAICKNPPHVNFV
jgi:MoaA/NifB/PqqE/SkfB family radical SAM enzyme